MSNNADFTQPQHPLDNLSNPAVPNPPVIQEPKRKSLNRPIKWLLSGGLVSIIALGAIQWMNPEDAGAMIQSGLKEYSNTPLGNDLENQEKLNETIREQYRSCTPGYREGGVRILFWRIGAVQTYNKTTCNYWIKRQGYLVFGSFLKPDVDLKYIFEDVMPKPANKEDDKEKGTETQEIEAEAKKLNIKR